MPRRRHIHPALPTTRQVYDWRGPAWHEAAVFGDYRGWYIALAMPAKGPRDGLWWLQLAPTTGPMAPPLRDALVCLARDHAQDESSQS